MCSSDVTCDAFVWKKKRLRQNKTRHHRLQQWQSDGGTGHLNLNSLPVVAVMGLRWGQKISREWNKGNSKNTSLRHKFVPLPIKITVCKTSTKEIIISIYLFIYLLTPFLSCGLIKGFASHHFFIFIWSIFAKTVQTVYSQPIRSQGFFFGGSLLVRPRCLEIAHTLWRHISHLHTKWAKSIVASKRQPVGVTLR